MNEINLLNTTSEKKQIIFNRWLRISTIFIFLTIFFVIILQLKQMYYINQLEKQKKRFEEKLIKFDDVVKEKNQIIEYKKKVQKQLNQIKKKSNKLNNVVIYNFLKKISDIIPNDVYLQNIEYTTKNGVSLKGISSFIESIINFLHNLDNLSFVKDIKLENLKSKEYQENENIQLHEFFVTFKLNNN